MSFDQDPNEQANISGADLAILVDDIKALQQARKQDAALIAELADALWRESKRTSMVGYTMTLEALANYEKWRLHEKS